MTHEDRMDILKEELDHFIRLANAQSEQLKKFAELQDRSHALINTLLQRLSEKEASKD